MHTESMTSSVVSLATQLAALHQEHRDAQIEAGEDCVDIETTERKYRRDEQVQAEQEAKEEAEDAAFWGDVTSVAKCVAAAASVAGAAFTGGSSLVVAAALIGGGLTVTSEIASKAGADKSVCNGLAIAGAACSLVAGGATALASAPTATTQATATAVAAANDVAAAATAGEGAATCAQKDAEADGETATADSKQAASDAENAGQTAEDAVAGMQRAMHDSKLQAQTEVAIMRSESETNAILANALRG
jgi:trimeric autotransporter adhesin